MDVLIAARRSGSDGDVDVIFTQTFPLLAHLAFLDDHIDAGVKGCEMCQKLPGEPAPDRPLRSVDGAASKSSRAGHPGFPDGDLYLVDNRAGCLHADFAGRGECHSSPPTMENSCSYLALKRPDLPRQSRLCEMEAARRPYESLLLADCDERLQLPQIHRLFIAGMR